MIDLYLKGFEMTNLICWQGSNAADEGESLSQVKYSAYQS